jgi:hypothetical protein
MTSQNCDGPQDFPSGGTSSLELHLFDPPSMTPVPIPEFATLDEANTWAFLRVDFAIDDPDALALHVAQLTQGMANLKDRIERLEAERLK